MNINSQTEQQPQEAALEQLDRTALLTLVKQMIQLHPDLSQLVNSLSTTHKLHYEPLNYEIQIFAMSLWMTHTKFVTHQTHE